MIALSELPKLINDYRLKGLDLSKYQDLDAMAFHLVTKGDDMQREAFAKGLSICSGAAYLSINTMFYRAIKKSGDPNGVETCIANILNDICEAMGAELSGSPRRIVHKIKDNYGHLSLVDLIKFSSMASDGYFKTEYQHVAARGINLEFLMDWLAKFDELRTQEVKSCHDDYRFKKGQLDSNNSLYLRQHKEKSKWLQMQRQKAAAQKRKDAVREIEREYKELVRGNHYRQFKDFAMKVLLYPIYSKEDAEANFCKLFENILADMKLAYAVFVKGKERVVNPYEEALFWVQSLKGLQRDIKKEFVDRYSPTSLLSASLQAYANFNNIELCRDLFAKIKVAVPGMGDSTDFFKNCNVFAAKTVRYYKGIYYSYLNNCIEKQAMPMSEKEFLLYKVRAFINERTGSCDVKKYLDVMASN